MTCGATTLNWRLSLSVVNTFPAGAGPVHIVLPLSNYIIRGGCNREYALYQLPELFLDFLETNDKNSSYHWDYNKLVERHEDAQARSFG